ncbi:MAG: SMC-Scp complex subunit ScpB [Gemmatimonadota bacterium]
MRPEQIIEATLFASQTPLTAAELARADESLTVARVLDALQALRDRYEEDERAFQVYQLGAGYQILTRPEFAPYLERFDSIGRSPVLSAAALETLAIIAYRQPIGRIEIEEIRGVGSSAVLRTLQEWELIEVVGRGEGLGRPLLYGTNQRFLDHFGFQSLDDLPSPQELSVALRAEGGASLLDEEDEGSGPVSSGAAAGDVSPS